MRHVYLAATGQNRGKTTAALGFLDGFLRNGLTTGFMKPVGQRTVIQDGVAADEDAVLMKAVFGLPDPLGAMSPVHIPRGFTKAYIAGEVVEDLGARIRNAHEMFADRDVLLVEGTGHAGVGAVVGLSNAVVAAMLRTPAIIVSEGGVGRPIDEIVLNASLLSWRAFMARRFTRAPTSMRSSAGSPSARWSPATCSSGSAPGRSSSFRATART